MVRLAPPAGGLTAKQETFAQAVARGETLTDAYRSAYRWSGSDSGLWREACLLRQNPKVAQRVDALTADITARQVADEDRLRMWVTDQLKAEATGAGSDSARVQALIALGRSVSMFTDRVIEEAGPERTASEIEADIQNRLARLIGS